MKDRFRWIFTIFAFVVVAIVIFLFGCFVRKGFGISRSDWLNALLSWLSVASAIFIGLIAYWQNERFKKENDVAGERNDKYHDDLVRINNRLIKIEENRERAYIAFLQGPVLVMKNGIVAHQTIHEKCYTGILLEKDKNRNLDRGTVLELGITNQTNVPIRDFELQSTSIRYENFETSEIQWIK